MPGGFVHLECREAYFETGDILSHVLHFSPGLSADERGELTRALGSSTGRTIAAPAEG